MCPDVNIEKTILKFQFLLDIGYEINYISYKSGSPDFIFLLFNYSKKNKIIIIFIVNIIIIGFGWYGLHAYLILKEMNKDINITVLEKYII